MEKIYLTEKIRQIVIKVFLLILILWATPLLNNAQTGPLYLFEYITGNAYTPLTTDSIPLYNDNTLPTRDEGLSTAIPIGFTFYYNYKSYTNFKVNTNGFVTLDENLAFDYFDVNNLNSSLRKLILAPLWDDLVIQPGGSIRYDLTGTAGSKILKIEFSNLSFWLGGSFHLKFQIWLYEGTNVIEFRYGDDDSTNGWRNYSDNGINIGLNDERNNSFMNIIPSTVEGAGPDPYYSLSDDSEFYYYGMENDVPAGLIYRFTPTTRWQGSTNSDWLTKTNWELDTIPTVADNALISSGKTNYPVINETGAICEDLNIESGGKITVTGGGELTVSGNLVNNGSVTVTSTSEASTGSLIVEGTTNATAAFERYVTGGSSIWHLISSPVNSQNINSFVTNTSNSIAVNGTKYGLGYYNESNDTWTTFTTATAPSAGNFVNGKGYEILTSTADTLSFTGTLINSDLNNIAINNNGLGWNLLGNPYTSAIAATLASGNTEYLLSPTNVSNLDASYAGIYIWDAASGSYKIINNAGGTPSGTFSQDYIQAGQGFFVRAKTGGGNFNITRNMQAHQSNAIFKSESVSWTTISLIAETNSKKSSTQITFNSQMTTGLDVTYDAGIFKNNTDFALYSRLVDDNGVDFALQCLPEDYENLVIPIGLDATGGQEVTIYADLYNLPYECEPILEDRITGKFVALNNSGSYTFNFDNRYEGGNALFLHTNKKSVTQTELEEFVEPFNIVSNTTDRYIRVISSINKSAIAQVYDISGRLVASKSINNGNNNIISLSGQPGIYVIRIFNDNYNYSKKIFWNK